MDPTIIDRERLARLMSLDDYFDAVESAFRAQAEGLATMPLPLHIEVEGGGFHAKGACVHMDPSGAEEVHGERAIRPWVAVKVNSNFPGNPKKGLPTIQGAVLLYDGADGRLLAILDSMEITSKRTAAASALAAHHLARFDARVMAVCGCGEQGRAQLAAIARVRDIARVFAWDADESKAAAYARDMSAKLSIGVVAVPTLRDATINADIIVTATSATTPFLDRGCVRPGTFIAAIGADAPHKSELHPELFVDTRLVVDAALSEVVIGREPGRIDDEEITIFLSTGLGIQDVASAAVAYQRFLEEASHA